MKKLLIIFLVIVSIILSGTQIYAENADITSEATSSTDTDSENNAEPDSNEERFGALMNDLYEYWLDYVEIEGDNQFEKVVNLAWKYRGDIGGIIAAIAVLVLLIFSALKILPGFRRCINYIGVSNANTKKEIEELISEELGKYAPSLATVDSVSKLYPQFEELISGISRELSEINNFIAKVGAKVEETENRHASSLALQGETFRDIISLSALPAAKKAEILEKYRKIESASLAEDKSPNE